MFNNKAIRFSHGQTVWTSFKTCHLTKLTCKTLSCFKRNDGSINKVLIFVAVFCSTKTLKNKSEYSSLSFESLATHCQIFRNIWFGLIWWYHAVIVIIFNQVLWYHLIKFYCNKSTSKMGSASWDVMLV